MKSDQPDQIENLIERIKTYIAKDKFRFSRHAIERQKERSILPQDALYVLTHGVHEKKKSSFDEKFSTWKYAIRGKTEDGIDTRVIVALIQEMVIITVIRVTKDKRSSRRKS